jgi:acetylornithine deacetylase/succinyl-diaminopimelate desuccinylase-like protein
MREHRDLVDAAIAINPDNRSGEFDHGKRTNFGIDTSEKTYVTYTFETTNRGGHSSEPRPDNAIYALAHALTKLEQYRFAFRTNATTRLFFQRMAALQTGQRKADYLAMAREPVDPVVAARLAEDTPLNALLHSTCVATMLAAGVQENALPSRATATVQCRIMPDETVDVLGAVNSSPESPPDPALFAKVETIVHGMWPGIPVVPRMDAGASDSIFTRNAGIPSYGLSGAFEDVNDIRYHGRDERIRQDVFYESVEFTYRLMKALTGGQVTGGR